MNLKGINIGKGNGSEKSIRKLRIRSTLYGRVIIIITVTAVILFLSLSLIFKSVHEQTLNNVIRQNGNNVGSVVEGALYYSMLENDKRTLQNTLDQINTLSGIDDVNMYDDNDSLVYSSFSGDALSHSNPDCRSCHSNLAEMFPVMEKSYRIVPAESDCIMNENDNSHRHLFIRSPILNERSCYTAACHAHSSDERVLGSLIIKMPLEEVDNSISQSSSRFFLIATIITLFLLTSLILFTSKQIKTPLNEIVKASLAVAEGNKTTRLAVNQNQLDDMRTVSEAFNNMLDKLQAANEELKNWSQQLEYKVRKKSEELGSARNELIQIERIASLGKLSSSVAHELNNPLSGILIYTKLIHKQLSNPELYSSKKESVLKHLKFIENETKRCGEIVKGLLDFSRKEQEDFETKNINDIILDTYELMLHPVTIANIKFMIDIQAKHDMVSCSPNQIKQACVALIVNATEAVANDGEITLGTSNPDSKTIRIDVSDNGIGIREDDIPHIFEPFFSTKHQTSGIGLGLAIVHGIVKNHNGTIDVRSEPGRGTTMSITLPLINS